MSKKEFPVMVSDQLVDALPKCAKGFVAEYKKDIYPILYKFGMLDDKHIQKYLNSVTIEDIYRDALVENEAAVKQLEQEALYDEERDVWKRLRRWDSPKKAPKEEGFVFLDMPLHDYSHRDIILKALSVKNGEILIDEAFLMEVSTIKPTAEQKELWDMLSDFCERFNKKGFNKKYDITLLFSADKNGTFPNVYTILKRLWISRKRDVS